MSDIPQEFVCFECSWYSRARRAETKLVEARALIRTLVAAAQHPENPAGDPPIVSEAREFINRFDGWVAGDVA